MDRNRLNYLLQSLAHGLLTPGEYDELMDLVHRKEAEGDLLEGMEGLLEEAPSGEVDEGLYRRIWEAAAGGDAAGQGLAALRERAPASGVAAPVHQLRRAYWIAAASVLLLAGLALWWRYATRPEKTPALSYATAKGERKDLYLPDSTHVWLNAGSRLSYSTGPIREVHLEGEAFFEVRKDPQKPFVVRTGDLSTQVLGTAFDVEAYTAKTVTITVAEGVVRVDSGDKALGRLTKDRQLRWYNGMVTLEDVSGTELSAWTNGELIFNNISMKEAAERIERWFGMPVRLDTAVSNARFTVSFKKGAPIKDVMDVVCMLNGCTYRMEKGEVLIR
ncbi:FecR family protein [Dinghuibacter silviterrae]|uniref:FecR family protein n=1 Tax=Dinghuibacter silviterrae TaxID=1539049 RepID=A0A4R8DGV3_9BACT|nr:FecR family protein [Dinghuibacter silviterrae]TDW96745.1 FecR family protein [Dinghuibacter silviterrae]